MADTAYTPRLRAQFDKEIRTKLTEQFGYTNRMQVPTLDKIVAMLKAKADWKITIEGHTDSTSTPQHNQDLSERRAASVKNYLQSAGIDPSRLKTAGFGDTKPVVKNDSELGRAQNRRVELIKQ